MNNRNLTILFLVLLGIFIASKLFEKDTGRSFEKVVINVDTSQVDKLTFFPKNEASSFSALRTNSGWDVVQGDVTARASESLIQSILNTLSKIEIQRIVAKSSDKWADYEVGEDSGFRLIAYDGDKVLEDIYIGRFNFNQQTRSATSYIRKNGSDDTYALDGFLSMSLNQSFDGLRDKSFLRIEKTALNGIEASIDNKAFTISKNGEQWFAGDGSVIDSTSMVQYLNGISNVQGATIIDGVNEDQLDQLGKVNFRTENGSSTVITIYTGEDQFILHSTENENTLFESDSTGIYKRVIVDLLNLVDTEN